MHAEWTNRYEVVHELGRGAFGVAFLAKPRVDNGDSDDFVVVKQVSLSRLRSKQEIDAAKQEIQVLQRFRHNNVVRFIDSFLESKNLLIVMEYADGGDLAARIEERRTRGANAHFVESYVCHLFAQLCVAIRHIHSHNILHRDLKPQNVFLHGPNDIIKLGDFGVARVLDHTHAMAQTQCGTPYFLSPEVWKGQEYGRKSDIWALGCILYELLSLKIPFKASSLPELATKIAKSEPPSLPERVTDEMKELVDLLLKKEPAQRPTASTLCQHDIIVYHVDTLFSRTLADTIPDREDETELKNFILDSMSPRDLRKKEVRALPAEDSTKGQDEAMKNFLENRKLAQRYKQRHEESMRHAVAVEAVKNEKGKRGGTTNSGAKLHSNTRDEQWKALEAARKEFVQQYKKNLRNAKKHENPAIQNPVIVVEHPRMEAKDRVKAREAQMDKKREDYVLDFNKGYKEAREDRRRLREKNKERGFMKGAAAWEIAFSSDVVQATEDPPPEATKQFEPPSQKEGHFRITKRPEESFQKGEYEGTKLFEPRSAQLELTQPLETKHPGNTSSAQLEVTQPLGAKQPLTTSSAQLGATQTLKARSKNKAFETTTPLESHPNSRQTELMNKNDSESGDEYLWISQDSLRDEEQSHEATGHSFSFKAHEGSLAQTQKSVRIHESVAENEVNVENETLKSKEKDITCDRRDSGNEKLFQVHLNNDIFSRGSNGESVSNVLHTGSSPRHDGVSTAKRPEKGSNMFLNEHEDHEAAISKERHSNSAQNTGNTTIVKVPQSGVRTKIVQSGHSEPSSTRRSSSKEQPVNLPISLEDKLPDAYTQTQQSTEVLKELVDQFQQERQQFQVMLQAHEERAKKDKEIIEQLVQLNAAALQQPIVSPKQEAGDEKQDSNRRFRWFYGKPKKGRIAALENENGKLQSRSRSKCVIS